MKARLKFRIGEGTIEFDAEGVKDAVKVMSEYMEVFGNQECGKCKSKSVFPEHRTDAEGHDYYSMKCLSCGAQLSFGQYKKGGGLFTKKKDKDNNWIPNNGWLTWQEQKNVQTEPRGEGTGPF